MLLNVVNYSEQTKRGSVLRNNRPAGISRELIEDAVWNVSDLELEPFKPHLFDLGSIASADKSLLRRSPGRDGISKATIKLQLKDKDGNAVVEGASVQLTASMGQLSPIAEENGVFTATLASTEAGTAIVEASLDGVKLLQTVQIEFYKQNQGDGYTHIPPANELATGRLILAAGKAGVAGLGREARLHIPAGTFDTLMRIAIEKLSDPDKLAGRLPGTLVSPVFEITKDVTGRFAQAASLTLQFKDNEIKNGQMTAIFYYDEAVQQWVKIGGIVNSTDISVNIDHFDKFAVFAIDNKPAPEDTTNHSANIPEDIKGHWAESGIREAIAQGLVNGYADGTFRPDRPVTREEFLVLLVRALSPAASGGSLHFRMGVTEGDGKQLYMGMQTTRAEAIIAILRIKKTKI